MAPNEEVPATDTTARTPLGVGESITRQGNELALGEDDETRRAGRRQGSVDPQEPGPEPEG